MTAPEQLVTVEERHPDSKILVVTSAWPHADNPMYGIFIQREQAALRNLGVLADVMFVRGYASPKAYALAGMKLLRQSRASNGYAVVHAYGGEAALAAMFYRPARLVVTYLGDDLLGTPGPDGDVPFRSRVRRAAIRVLAKRASRTVTRSRAMEEVLPEAVRRRNTILPAGVDDTLFRPIDRERARHELGWRGDERVVLFAADPAVPGKRFGLASDAVELARANVPDVRLHVVRDTPPDQVPTLMAAADCLLLTSASEGSPNVVKEAVMCNLAIVTVRVGDVEETLRGVEPSWICGADPAALAAALVAGLQSPIRSNGRATADRLTASSIAEKVLGVYEEAAARPL
jgi:glycosyltransferase involved in cell wall biosynthesis